MRSIGLCLVALGSDGDLLGNRPHEPSELTRNSHDHLVGVFSARYQASVAFAQANLGFPTDVLDGFGVLFESQLQVATGFRGITIRSRAFNQYPTGMSIASCGDGALTTPLTRGIF
jgi:hypothetical protein